MAMQPILPVLTLLAVLSPPDCHPADLARLPPLWVAQGQVEFLTEATHYARHQAAWHRHDARGAAWAVRARDLWEVREAWDWLRLAHEARGWPDICRARLRSLREAVGADAYAAGVMPRAW